MNTRLVQLEQRIEELERLADDVMLLAERLSRGEAVQPELSIKGQQWYRAARELLEREHFSGLEEFEACYYSFKRPGSGGHRAYTDIEHYINQGTNSFRPFQWQSSTEAQEHFGLFSHLFQTARSLVRSLVEELISRELPVRSQLSFSVASDELDTAEEILREAGNAEVFLRVAGVIARIALERHFLTLAETRSVKIEVNPPSKKHPGIDDALVSLEKARVITPIQKSELGGLVKIGNNCAHPKESVMYEDVKRLITRGRELSATLV